MPTEPVTPPAKKPVTTPTTAAAAALRPDAYYETTTGKFWWKNPRGKFIPLNDNSFRRLLHKCGYSSASKGGRISKLDEAIQEYQRSYEVDWATPLAGYPQGFLDTGSVRILVTSSPFRITPNPGKWPTTKAFLNGLFGNDEDGLDQMPYVYGWLRFAAESVYVLGNRRPGQAIVIAGPHNCGKSLFQKLVTEILGRRASKPYRYMSGSTNFNSDLFGSEHLIIEDEVASTQLARRRHFGARIKDFTVNDTQSCHAKGRAAFTLIPCWRLSISLNDEPENMMILPPLEDSIKDKLILLRAYKRPMPMPTRTTTERNAFWATLISEVPAFVNFLLNYEIPPELAEERFGIASFHHPTLVRAINELSPEQQLAELIDIAILNDRSEWEGAAADLKSIFMSAESAYVRDTAKKLLDWPSAAANYLRRLQTQDPEHFQYKRTNSKRLWKLTRNGESDGRDG